MGRGSSPFPQRQSRRRRAIRALSRGQAQRPHQCAVDARRGSPAARQGKRQRMGCQDCESCRIRPRSGLDADLARDCIRDQGGRWKNADHRLSPARWRGVDIHHIARRILAFNQRNAERTRRRTRCSRLGDDCARFRDDVPQSRLWIWSQTTRIIPTIRGLSGILRRAIFAITTSANRFIARSLPEDAESPMAIIPSGNLPASAMRSSTTQTAIGSMPCIDLPRVRWDS